MNIDITLGAGRKKSLIGNADILGINIGIALGAIDTLYWRKKSIISDMQC